MKKFGVIGFPLTHSLSPQIHNFAFKNLKIDAMYEKIEIAPENFSDSISQLKSAGYSGLNITIPYKQKIMSFLDEIDNDANTVGAVNTIVNNGGKWIGYNTDVYGFMSPVIDLKERITDCLVLGSGGATRAVIYTLAKYLEPKSITIAARNPEKSVNLRNEFGAYFNKIQIFLHSFEDTWQILSKFNLIVNTTPLGTFPNIDQTPLLNMINLRDQTIVYDLVYNPLETKFLKDAEKAGKNIFLINGMEMLIQQAASAFKLWTNKEMLVGEVKNYILSNQ